MRKNCTILHSIAARATRRHRDERCIRDIDADSTPATQSPRPLAAAIAIASGTSARREVTLDRLAAAAGQPPMLVNVEHGDANPA